MSAWTGNWTNDCFLVFAWEGPGSERVVVAVNYSDHQSQCRVRLPFANLAGKQWRLEERFDSAVFERSGDELVGPGLYLDMQAWQTCVFFCQPMN